MLSRFKKIWHRFIEKLTGAFLFVKFLIWPRNKWLGRVMSLSLVSGLFLVGSRVYAANNMVVNFVFWLLNLLLFKIAQLLGWICMKIFGMVLVVSSYNNFVTHPAVTKGWVLMRDMCNLFFVMILLVIAFMVILQVKKYEPTKMLYRVVLVAILVNFSKLICGLVIDFAQVVMMTFVNGYAASAGGNLVNALNLNKLVEMTANENTAVDTAFQITVTLIASCVVLVATIVVIFFILILLTLRITQLWILIVLSPFAFTLEAVPLGGMQQEAAKWFQRFGWTVAVGPFMAFFLWLSLLVMSDPKTMVGAMATAKQVEGIGSKIDTKNIAVTTMEGLTQAAIGLSMLFGALMIAQEAGGMVGDMAKTGVAATKSATKWAVNRATGGIPEKSAAAFKGYQGKRQELKQLKMAKSGRIGESLAGAQATAGRIPGMLGRTLLTAPRVGSDLYDTHFNKGKNQKKRAEKAEAKAKAKKERKERNAKLLKKYGGGVLGQSIKRNWENSDPMAQVFNHRIKQSHMDQKNKEANDLLSARNIDKLEELKDVIKDTSKDKNIRRMAILKMSQLGFEDDGADVPAGQRMTKEQYAEMSRDLIVGSGDKESQKAFEGNLEKKQIDLLYNISDEGEQKALKKRMAQGDIDMKGQNSEVFENVKFLDDYRQQVGAKKFGAMMSDTSKRGDQFKEAVKASMPELAERVHVDFAKQEAELTDPIELDKKVKARKAKLDDKIAVAQRSGNTAEVARLETEKNEITPAKITDYITKKIAKERKGFQAAQMAVGGKLEDAFGQRNAAGGLTGILDSKDPAMNEFIAQASGKTIAGFEVDESTPDAVIAALAKNLSNTQLDGIINSGEDGAGQKANVIIKQMIADQGSNPEIRSQLKSMKANNRISGNFDPEIRTKVDEIFKADKEEDEKKAEAKENAKTEAKAKAEAEAKAKAEAEARAKSKPENSPPAGGSGGGGAVPSGGSSGGGSTPSGGTTINYTYSPNEPVEWTDSKGVKRTGEYEGEASREGYVKVRRNDGKPVEAKAETVGALKKIGAKLKAEQEAFLAKKYGTANINDIYDTQE